MKKKVLFVMNNLRVGGAEKALVSLLENFDYSKYDVDLQLFTNDGLFLKQLTEKVNLLPPLDEFTYYDMPFFKALSKAALKGRFDILKNRILAIKIFKTEKIPTVLEQRVWKYIGKGISKSPKIYDAAIGFLEKNPTYYVIEKVIAKTKIGYIHNDYDELGMDPEIDRDYFPFLDFIVTDSEECKNILATRFPDQQSKIKVLYNIVSPELINKLSKVAIEEVFPDKINIISVGRFSPQKGYELSIDAFKILKDKGIDFHWTILGKGELEESMKKQIEENGIAKQVSFLGIKENHYPYVKKADIFLQTSHFEGKSIAIDEAKILAKPILVTNFNTAKDQIENNFTGIIAEKNAEGIADKLEILIKNKDLRQQLTENLKTQNLGTLQEIKKVYEMIETPTKKVLFVMNNLEMGGAEKSLITLLENFNNPDYKVDLLLLQKKGILIDRIPKTVNVLPSKNYSVFDMDFFGALNIIAKEGEFKKIKERTWFGFLNRKKISFGLKEQKSWKYLKNSLPEIMTYYSTSIGYLEKTPVYYICDKTFANQKIGWIHTDLEAKEIDFDEEAIYLKKLNKIVTVSDVLSEKLRTVYPNLSEKIITIENISEKNKILQLSQENCDLVFDKNFFNIIFVGRLAAEKNLALAIKAIKQLIVKNHNVRLYLIGEGNKKKELQNLAKILEISQNIIFLGQKSNPYPYVKNSDLFLLTSLYEGKSISLEEAKILQKPIVVTNFSTVNEQIEDYVTGLIAEQNPNSVAEKIEEIVTNKQLEKTLIENLSQVKGNEAEILTFNAILNQENL